MIIKKIRAIFRKLVLDQWAAIHASKEKGQEDRPDWRILVIYITAAVCLTLMHYYGHTGIFHGYLAKYFRGSPYLELYSQMFWSLCCFVGYMVIPMIVISFLPGMHIRDFGLSFKGFTKHVWIYGVLFLLVLPFVIGVSFTDRFQSIYPFYRMARRSVGEFVIFEIFYIFQFFSLEFFFRGFLLFGPAKRLGFYAIPVMLVPYAMIHFSGKPFMETLGAVVAGLVLGTLALRTRSIWCGVLIHGSVALSMDLLSMAHKGWL